MPDGAGAIEARTAGCARSTRPGNRALDVLAAIAVAGGLVARFAARSPLWLDEALTVNIARLPLGSIGDALRRDGHPPLYYWMLHGWIDLFGSGDAAVRVLSGVFAVLALPVAAVAGQRFAGRTGAVVALAFTATSPFTIRYATEARMYTLVMLLVFLGALALPAALRRPSLPRLAAVTGITAALLYSHYWSTYLITVVGAALLWRSREGARRRPNAKVLAAMVVGVVAFLPWLPILRSQTTNTGTPWAAAVRPSVLVTWTVRDIGGYVDDGGAVGVALVVLVLLGAFGAGVDRRHIDLDLRGRDPIRWIVALMLATMALGATVSYVARTAYQTRYAAVVVPLVLLAAAAGVTRFTAAGARAVVTATVMALSAPGIVANAVQYRTQGREVVDQLNARAAAGDVVLYCPDQLGPAFSRHLRRDLRTETYPTGSGPEFVDWRHYAARNAAANPEAFAQQVLAATSAANTIWMVWVGGYRTYGDQCERLDNVLRAGRPAGGTEVPDRPTTMEHATLVSYHAGG